MRYVKVLVIGEHKTQKWKGGRNGFHGRKTKVLVLKSVKCHAKKALLFSLKYPSKSFVNPFIYLPIPSKIFSMYFMLGRVCILIPEAYRARRACKKVGAERANAEMKKGCAYQGEDLALTCRQWRPCRVLSSREGWAPFGA